MVGAGKFGGPRSSPEAKMPADAPKRAPDAVMKEKTSVDQVSGCIVTLNLSKFIYTRVHYFCLWILNFLFK